MVLFDQATYDKLLVEVPKYKLITPSVLSDRLRVRSSHKMLIYWIMLLLPSHLCSCLRDGRKTLCKMNLLWTKCFLLQHRSLFLVDQRIADPLSLNAIASHFFYVVQAIGYVLTKRLQLYQIGLVVTGLSLHLLSNNSNSGNPSAGF